MAELETKKNINQIIDEGIDNLIGSFSGKDLEVSSKIIDNVISIIGASGGVGTSTIAANLAYKLTKKGMRVMLIDLNVMYPIQHSLWGLQQVIERKDLVSFVSGANPIGESIVNLEDLALLYSNNRYLMDYINIDNETASNNLAEAIRRVKHLFDMIIIDCPRSIESDLVNTVLYNSDLIYTVFDESIGCVANIDRMRKNMLVSGIEAYAKVKIIVNKKTNVYYPKSVFNELGLDVVETLPFDTAIIESGIRGEIFCKDGASMSKNAAAFMDKMDSLTEKVLKFGGYGDGQ